MAYLVDTCVLLRAFERRSPEHPAIMKALIKAYRNDVELYVAVQNVAEFWNVSTRPIERNGAGLPVDLVSERVRAIERFTTIVTESRASYVEWKRMTREFAILGVKVHDARLASVMIAEQIPRLMTLNVGDFKRFAEIETLTPWDALATMLVAKGPALPDEPDHES